MSVLTVVLSLLFIIVVVFSLIVTFYVIVNTDLLPEAFRTTLREPLMETTIVTPTEVGITGPKTLQALGRGVIEGATGAFYFCCFVKFLF